MSCLNLYLMVSQRVNTWVNTSRHMTDSHLAADNLRIEPIRSEQVILRTILHKSDMRLALECWEWGRSFL